MVGTSGEHKTAVIRAHPLGLRISASGKFAKKAKTLPFCNTSPPHQTSAVGLGRVKTLYPQVGLAVFRQAPGSFVRWP